MDPNTEKQIVLSNVTIQLMTVNWEGTEDTPAYQGYNLSQRLSTNHPPLRIGKISTREVLPRVRAVGLLPPGMPIRLFPAQKPLRCLLCIFDETYFETVTGIARAQWEAHAGELVAMKNKRLEILMQELLAEINQPDYGSELLLDSVCSMLVVELSRHMRQLLRKSGNRHESMALAPWQLRRLHERIQASTRLGYPKLTELAELCGLSQGHLARSFKAATGWQIQKYIAEERLNTAKTLLSREELSCEEIAMQLGFKSPAYFATVFRRMTGKSPTEFRRWAAARTDAD